MVSDVLNAVVQLVVGAGEVKRGMRKDSFDGLSLSLELVDDCLTVSIKLVDKDFDHFSSFLSQLVNFLAAFLVDVINDSLFIHGSLRVNLNLLANHFSDFFLVILTFQSPLAGDGVKKADNQIGVSKREGGVEELVRKFLAVIISIGAVSDEVGDVAREVLAELLLVIAGTEAGKGGLGHADFTKLVLEDFVAAVVSGFLVDVISTRDDMEEAALLFKELDEGLRDIVAEIVGVVDCVRRKLVAVVLTKLCRQLDHKLSEFIRVQAKPDRHVNCAMEDGVILTIQMSTVEEDSLKFDIVHFQSVRSFGLVDCCGIIVSKPAIQSFKKISIIC